MTNGNLSNPRVSGVTQKVVQAAQATLGDKLDKVILFGSYARGDFDEDSDIDFLIIAHITQEEAGIERRNIRSRLPGIDLEYDMTVSLHVTGSHVFYDYVDTLPFYKTVMQEGMVLSG